MRKREFLEKLRTNLKTVRNNESDEILSYYDEIIQDAVDNGENEAEFISKLGSIDEIIETIRKDVDFVQKLKERRDSTLMAAINTTAKILGYSIFALVTFIIVVVGFSFVISGVSTVIYSSIILAVSESSGVNLILMRLGNIVFGIGLVMFALGVLKWYFRVSKSTVKKLLQEVQKRLRKEEQKNV